MRTYPTNEKGEKMYQLECKEFDCMYSEDAVITMVWRKEYARDIKCEKCGCVLEETQANWSDLNPLIQSMK